MEEGLFDVCAGSCCGKKRDDGKQAANRFRRFCWRGSFRWLLWCLYSKTTICSLFFVGYSLLHILYVECVVYVHTQTHISPFSLACLKCVKCMPIDWRSRACALLATLECNRKPISNGFYKADDRNQYNIHYIYICMLYLRVRNVICVHHVSTRSSREITREIRVYYTFVYASTLLASPLQINSHVSDCFQSRA